MEYFNVSSDICKSWRLLRNCVDNLYIIQTQAYTFDHWIYDYNENVTQICLH